VTISQHHIPTSIETGITVDQFIPGFVPLYELQEACIHGNYSWHMWESLDYNEQVYCVAAYRMHNLIERHVQQAVNKYMERQGQRGQNG
jgi:hypothetical protein